MVRKYFFSLIFFYGKTDLRFETSIQNVQCAKLQLHLTPLPNSSFIQSKSQKFRKGRPSLDFQLISTNDVTRCLVCSRTSCAVLSHCLTDYTCALSLQARGSCNQLQNNRTSYESSYNFTWITEVETGNAHDV